MNFKLNALVVAAMMVAAGTAHAKIADSNDNSAAVNNSGDMFVDLVSVSNNASYTADLGLTLNQFAAAPVNALGVKLVWDLDAGTFSDLSAVSTGLVTQTLTYGSIYTTFATTAVATASDLKFDIKAMDGVPTSFAAAGTNRYLSTSASSAISAANSQVFGMDAWDPITLAANGDLTNSTHGTDFNTAGANMYDTGDSQNTYFQAAGDQWNGQVNFQSTGLVNDLAGTTDVEGALNFFFLSNSSSTPASQATITQYAGVWTFDETTAQLMYSTTPVPEAETYAMMLAGLGLVGFMVSRRRNLV